MDIEGSELGVLMGAKNTIKNRMSNDLNGKIIGGH